MLVKKDIVYCSIKDLVDGKCELGMTVSGMDLIDMMPDEALVVLKDNNQIKDGNVIIPKGVSLCYKEDNGGATEYVFDEGNIVVDLVFDGDEEKFINNR